MRAAYVTIALMLAVAAPACAASFRLERAVTPGGPGPNRLAVDVPLLVGSRPLRYESGPRFLQGLEDLRLYDASGAEVPYLVVSPPVPAERWETGRIIPVLATDDASGFEIDLGDTIERIDRLRLGGLPRSFMKRVRLEGSGDRRRWDLLVAEGTLFDLPDEGLSQSDLAFAPGEFRYLRVTWDDRNSGRLPMPNTATARLVIRESPPPPLRFPLTFERRTSEPGRSRFRLHLPGPDLPVVALELECAGGHLLRPVQVSEAHLTGDEMVPVALGRGTLRRTIQSDLVAADLRIPIALPHEADLDLVVEDGSNPPLELTGVYGELAPLPWLYFESSSGAALAARYGDPHLPAPRYDLEAVRPSLTSGSQVDARWGDVRALAPPEAESAPTDSAVPAVGASLDLNRFRWTRRVPPSPPGLTALVLDAAILSHSRDLADVRLADAGGHHQVPYIVERLDEPLELVLDELHRVTDEDNAPKHESRYRLALPYDGLPGARLVLTTTARVFERRVSVRVEHPPINERSEARIETVASATWRHADPETAASPLVLELPRLGATAATLIIDEGDNSPLPLARPKLLLPTYRLRFFRPTEQDLALLYGDPELQPPRYDLALLVPHLVGASAHEVTADAESKPTQTAVTARDNIDRRAFWGALVVAVVVLVALIARLIARVEPT
jgi:hypothetical protein